MLNGKRLFLIHNDGTDEILGSFPVAASNQKELLDGIYSDSDDLELVRDNWELNGKSNNFNDYLINELNNWNAIEITELFNPYDSTTPEQQLKQFGTTFFGFCNPGTDLDIPDNIWNDIICIIQLLAIPCSDIKWGTTFNDFMNNNFSDWDGTMDPEDINHIKNIIKTICKTNVLPEIIPPDKIDIIRTLANYHFDPKYYDETNYALNK